MRLRNEARLEMAGESSPTTDNVGKKTVVDRDNKTWLEDLQSEGSDQQTALSDLRAALLRGLRRGLSTYPGANDAFLEDSAQNALLRILDRLPQFQGRSRFLTWATAIAIRMAITELRHRHWKDVSLEAVTQVDTSGAHPKTSIEIPEPSMEYAQRAMVAKMYEVMESHLTEKQRTALLAELGGMPQSEIGRHLGSSRNAVYKLTHDARKRLRQGLEDAGYAAEDVQAAFAV